MIVTINNIKWKIIYTKDYIKKDEKYTYDGLASNNRRCIKIWSERYNQSPDYFKKVICHEVTHAVLMSQGRGPYVQSNFTDEQLCDFIAYNSEFICDLTNKIYNDFKQKYKNNQKITRN